MAKSSVFDFNDYKSYLVQVLETRGDYEKGQRSKMAKAIECNPSYLSQILNGSLDLSLEQAHRTNAFLGHTPGETKYFLNLVQMSRAGTKELRSYFSDEVKQQKEDRAVIKNRIQVNRFLDETAQARYYSSWYFAAIHVCVSLPHLKTREQIAEALALPLKTVNEAVEFLISVGIFKTQGNELRPGEVNLYLANNSPFVGKHHANWRTRALQSLDQVEEKDLHYSSVITCSKEDVDQIKEIMIQTIEKIRGVVRPSKDETAYVYCLDLFHLLSGGE